MRLRLRLTVILSVLLLANIYVTTVFWMAFPALSQNRLAYGAGVAFLFFLQLLAPIVLIASRTGPPSHFLNRHARKFQFVAFSVLGLFSSLFFFTAALEIFRVVVQTTWKFASASPPADFASMSALTVLSLTLVTGAMGVWEATTGPRINEVDVTLDHLPKSFDGLRLVQISDLHISPMIGRDYALRVKTLVESLNPDVVAMTGDFADGSVQALTNSMAPLGDIRPPLGKFFVTGNHEYYSGAEQWMAEHRRLGAKVLMNENVILRRGDDALAIAGTPDIQASAFRMEGPNLDKALAGIPAGTAKILMTHRPSDFAAAEAAGIDLQISGHAGQFFPWSLVVGLFHRYFRGLHRHGRMWIYVNRGTGYWGPPLRTIVPAEITLFRLRSGSV